jgi:hypothetical protein
MDIDTPEGSVVGNVNGGTQYTHQWSVAEFNKIQDFKQYHCDMYNFFEDLEMHGPGKEEPKRPKGGYKSLLQREKKGESTLTGQELHDYLVKSCATSSSVSCPKIGEVRSFASLEGIKAHLISGYQGLKKANSGTIAASIDYGDWLNVAFELHSIAKLAGKETGSWEKWLYDNVGIKASYGRKLRAISEVLGKYPGFRKLGLPISDLYGLLKQIKGLLVTDIDAAKYWQQVN